MLPLDDAAEADINPENTVLKNYPMPNPILNRSEKYF
jgi:hypothetical protein